MLNYQFLSIRYILLFCILLITSCRQSSIGVYQQLRAYADTFEIIDTHEHQQNPRDLNLKDHHFYVHFGIEYPFLDAVSAGAIEKEADEIYQADMDTLWNWYGHYFKFIANTSFTHQFKRGFEILYDFDAPIFNAQNIESLSNQIRVNYQDYSKWFDKACDLAGIELMFVDNYWDPLNPIVDQDNFALVFPINPLVYEIASKPDFANKTIGHVYQLAQKRNVEIHTLDDYLAFCDQIFEMYLQHHVVCVKNSMAYGRSLDYEEVTYKRAQYLYQRSSASLNDLEKKELQDFMFHWIIQKCINVDLPIQIHTGYLARNSDMLNISDPLKLNNLFVKYPDAKFVLFHGGYPWTSEYVALGKMFPNVYLDLVWLSQISRTVGKRVWHEVLDCVPYNKLFWGGDMKLIEGTVGVLDIAKDDLAQVLTERVEQDLITLEMAKDIETHIFRTNAIEVFKLKEKGYIH